jgi:hypothetical protein
MKSVFRGLRRQLPPRSPLACVPIGNNSFAAGDVRVDRLNASFARNQRQECYLSIASSPVFGTQQTASDWARHTDELLESQTGTWDAPTWRSAFRTFHHWASQSEQDKDSVRRSISLLLRLLHERPHSSESAGLMNQLLKQVLSGGGTSVPYPSVHECISDCLSQGWHADKSTFTMLIEIACQQGNPAMAEEWLTSMWKAAEDNMLLQPDRYSYTAIVQAWARSGDSQKATARIQTLVRDLQRLYRAGDESLKPTEACYVGWIVAIQRRNKSDAPEQAERILFQVWRDAEQDDFYPSYVLYNAVMHAWARRGQAERAQTLLHHMCRAYLEGTNKYCLPDVSSFSTVILAWSKSGLPVAPEQAEKLLQQMQEFYEATGLESVQPNTQTLTSVLDCWAKSNLGHAPERAETILRRMQKHYQAGNDRVRPNTVTFNTCMNAWARSGSSKAPERVESLFRDMQRQYLSGDMDLRPCPISYMARISAWERAKRRDSAEWAQAALDEMIILQDPDVSPATLHFNRVILSWARRGEASKAAALLQQMIDNQSHGMKHSAPNLSSFNFALSAWAKSGSNEALQQSEETLLRMSDLAVRPDTASFNTVLNCCARSPGNYLKARSILDLQISRYKSGDHKCKPDVYGYTSVIESCAREPGSMGSRKKAFSMALATFEQIKLYDEPNHVSFGAMLKACSTLLPSTSPRRSMLIEEIFRKCCEAGCVSTLILYHLHAATSPQIYKDLLQGYDEHTLPKNWTFGVNETNGIRTHRKIRKSTTPERGPVKAKANPGSQK